MAKKVKETKKANKSLISQVGRKTDKKKAVIATLVALAIVISSNTSLIKEKQHEWKFNKKIDEIAKIDEETKKELTKAEELPKDKKYEDALNNCSNSLKLEVLIDDEIVPIYFENDGEILGDYASYNENTDSKKIKIFDSKDINDKIDKLEQANYKRIKETEKNNGIYNQKAEDEYENAIKKLQIQKAVESINYIMWEDSEMLLEDIEQLIKDINETKELSHHEKKKMQKKLQEQRALLIEKQKIDSKTVFEEAGFDHAKEVDELSYEESMNNKKLQKAITRVKLASYPALRNQFCKSYLEYASLEDEYKQKIKTK